MSTNTGGPAFPRPAVFTGAQGLASIEQDGMTLRDYFAAKAMQALVITDLDKWPAGADASVSVASYWLADAMLEAREA